ncbi:energy transducer TonB [Pelagicoccus mobilis]|uniref:Energy transducer TonB n=1 Tax=Pelagicoccus mobilis TaxID=415221 RepID=A0A934RWC4_9BACT|nr:energy transducer TonB [Pelagicoccus mobilis]MBK1876389.1 energy transducer TonB [Pelagicoccus mobilis]
MNRELSSIFLALSLCALPLTQAQVENQIDRYEANAAPMVEFEIHQTIEPIYPPYLKNVGYEDGSATLAIVINQFGELEDYLLLEATHIQFGQAVEKVLPKWKFSAPLVNGETAAIASKLKVNFKRGQGVVYESFGYYSLENKFINMMNRSDFYRIYTLDELDRIPIPTKIEKPLFHTELLEDRDLVTAVFEFYIDTEGRVRIPTLREADDKVDERLLIIAQNAISQWRFEPPQRKGKAVVAKAAQPFHFRPVNEK